MLHEANSPDDQVPAGRGPESSAMRLILVLCPRRKASRNKERIENGGFGRRESVVSLLQPLQVPERLVHELRFDPPGRAALNRDIAPKSLNTFRIEGDSTFSGLPARSLPSLLI